MAASTTETCLRGKSLKPGIRRNRHNVNAGSVQKTPNDRLGIFDAGRVFAADPEGRLENCNRRCDRRSGIVKNIGQAIRIRLSIWRVFVISSMTCKRGPKNGL